MDVLKKSIMYNNISFCNADLKVSKEEILSTLGLKDPSYAEFHLAGKGLRSRKERRMCSDICILCFFVICLTMFFGVGKLLYHLLIVA